MTSGNSCKSFYGRPELLLARHEPEPPAMAGGPTEDWDIFVIGKSDCNGRGAISVSREL